MLSFKVFERLVFDPSRAVVHILKLVGEALKIDKGPDVIASDSGSKVAPDVTPHIGSIDVMSVASGIQFIVDPRPLAAALLKDRVGKHAREIDLKIPVAHAESLGFCTNLLERTEAHGIIRAMPIFVIHRAPGSVEFLQSFDHSNPYLHGLRLPKVIPIPAGDIVIGQFALPEIQRAFGDRRKHLTPIGVEVSLVTVALAHFCQRKALLQIFSEFFQTVIVIRNIPFDANVVIGPTLPANLNVNHGGFIADEIEYIFVCLDHRSGVDFRVMMHAQDLAEGDLFSFVVDPVHIEGLGHGLGNGDPDVQRDLLPRFFCPLDSGPEQRWIERGYFQKFRMEGIVSNVESGPGVKVCGRTDLVEGLLYERSEAALFRGRPCVIAEVGGALQKWLAVNKQFSVAQFGAGLRHDMTR